MLDTLTAAARDELFATAVHEAGHAVIAVLHGAQVYVSETAATRGSPIAAPGGVHAVGWTRYLPFDVAIEQSKYLVTAAGPAAEAVIRSGPNPTAAQLEAVLHGPDRDQLRRAVLTASIGHPAAAVHEVMPMVLRVWPAIAGLACEIDQRAVRDVDVVKALGVSSDPGQRAFELSNIRAGMRGVPDPRKVWA